MSTHFKQYKLVPLNQYEDLVANSKLKQVEVAGSTKTDEGSVETDNKIRSISGIQEKASMMESNDHDVTKGFGRGGGGKPDNLMWLFDDDSKLPQFSRQSRLADSFEQYKNVLHATNIPDHVKIKLMQLYKDRYDSYRNDKMVDDDDYDSDTYVDDGLANATQRDGLARKKAISDILFATPDLRVRKVKVLGNALLDNTDYINWNSKGDFTYPAKYKHSKHLNLFKLLTIATSKASGTPTEMNIILDIIRPFYQNIKGLVKNDEILKHMAEWDKRAMKRSRKSTRKRGRNFSYYENI